MTESSLRADLSNIFRGDPNSTGNVEGGTRNLITNLLLTEIKRYATVSIAVDDRSTPITSHIVDTDDLYRHLRANGNRQVCQYQFKRFVVLFLLGKCRCFLYWFFHLKCDSIFTRTPQRNDIVWICRECQKDETCVLCNECFQGSNHQGHDVYFYHSQVRT
jgi:Putative zinc finger in N-recognin (UBR box)